MKISKILSILGMLLILWSLVSGFYFHYSTSADGSNFESGYTLKFGTTIIGIILFYLGRRMR